MAASQREGRPPDPEQAGEAWRQACLDYWGDLSRAAIQGVDALRDELLRQGQREQAPLAPEECYDLWLESAEGAYRQVAFTEEHARHVAAVANAWAALREAAAPGNPELAETLPPAGLLDPGAWARQLERGFAALAGQAELGEGVSRRSLEHEQDQTRLFRYEPLTRSQDAIPVLIVYALVNRPYVMDLQEDRSLIRGLLKAGLDVYLLDWGRPGPGDQGLSLDDYINRYLGAAVDCIRERRGLARINLLGACQGGVFSLCFAALHPDKVARLVTTVTPVDFHTRHDLLSHLARRIDIDRWVDGGGNVPGECLNWLFAIINPGRCAGRKYRERLSRLGDQGQLETFLRMERWIADSPPQAGAACRQFVKDFYQQNKLVKGQVRIGGRRVDLENIAAPVLNVYAQQDHIVPPDAAKALAGCLGDVAYEELALPGGHIGIYVGAASQGPLPAAISDWLRQGPDRGPSR